jgi:hypothetical protein
MDDYIGLFIVVPLFILAVAAILGAICLALVTAVTRNVIKDRSRARYIALLFPLAAITYLLTGFLSRDFVRESRGSDGYFGSSYHYPLVNGYQFEFSGEYPDGGFIRGPIGFGESAVAVQVAGKWIFVDQGEIASSHEPHSSGSFIYHGPDNNPTVELGHDGQDLADKFKREREKEAPKHYLLVDTITSEVTHVNFENLKMAARKQGVALNLLTTEQALHSAVLAAAPGRGFLIMLFSPILLVSTYLLYKLRQLVRAV